MNKYTFIFEIADSFSRKTGAVVVGVCPELLLNVYCHE